VLSLFTLKAWAHQRRAWAGEAGALTPRTRTPTRAAAEGLRAGRGAAPDAGTIAISLSLLTFHPPLPTSPLFWPSFTTVLYHCRAGDVAFFIAYAAAVFVKPAAPGHAVLPPAAQVLAGAAADAPLPHVCIAVRAWAGSWFLASPRHALYNALGILLVAASRPVAKRPGGSSTWLAAEQAPVANAAQRMDGFTRRGLVNGRPRTYLVPTSLSGIPSELAYIAVACLFR